MAFYRLAGQVFQFTCPALELESYRLEGLDYTTFQSPSISPPQTLYCKMMGWVGSEQRQVESWSAPPGILLKVKGGSDFYISPGSQAVVRVPDKYKDREGHGDEPPVPFLTGLDRDILLGPTLVLALAMRGVWCLHASAATYKGQRLAFVGESGQGKSTLVAFLASDGSPAWERLADDILPITLDAEVLQAWPRYPQLKLPPEAQPGLNLPEHIPLERICLLVPADLDAKPELQPMPVGEAVRVLVQHTAGTRLFGMELLGEHLNFCAEAAKRVPIYRLFYPHSKDILPRIKELLESLW